MTIRAVALAALLLTGCASPLVQVSPLPAVGFERLGRVEGTGCGTLAMVGPIVIAPIGIHTRLPRAREAALAQRPGATGLVDVRITERWSYYLFALTRCTTLSGEAIR